MRAHGFLALWCLGCGMFEIFLTELGWSSSWQCDFLLATLVIVGRYFSFSMGLCAILCIGLLKEGWAGMPIGFYILHAQGVWIWSRIMGEAVSVWIIGWMGGLIWLSASWMISGFLLVHDYPITFPISTWIWYPFQCALTCGGVSFLTLWLFKDTLYQDQAFSSL